MKEHKWPKQVIHWTTTGKYERGKHNDYKTTVK
jgi:hypothetical protein